MIKTWDEPSDVSAEHGQVVVEGPDGIEYAMTPEAAALTSARLLESAARAHGQRRKTRDGAH